VNLYEYVISSAESGSELILGQAEKDDINITILYCIITKYRLSAITIKWKPTADFWKVLKLNILI